MLSIYFAIQCFLMVASIQVFPYLREMVSYVSVCWFETALSCTARTGTVQNWWVFQLSSSEHARVWAIVSHDSCCHYDCVHGYRWRTKTSNFVKPINLFLPTPLPDACTIIMATMTTQQPPAVPFKVNVTHHQWRFINHCFFSFA